MTMPADTPLPDAGDTNWRDDWGAEQEAASDEVRGRLSDASLRAAYVPSDRLVLSPTAPVNPAPGTVWINTTV